MYVYLNSELDSEWSISGPEAHWIGCYMGPRAGLDAGEKTSSHCREFNFNISVDQPIVL
jgi:hypothetical protein